MSIQSRIAACNVSSSAGQSTEILLLLPPRRDGEVSCLSVCLSVREHISGTRCPIFAKLLCMLPMSDARSSSGGFAIRYALPVSWLTSYLQIMGHMRWCPLVTLEQPAWWCSQAARPWAVAEAASRKPVTLWCGLLQTADKVSGLWLTSFSWAKPEFQLNFLAKPVVSNYFLKSTNLTIFILPQNVVPTTIIS